MIIEALFRESFDRHLKSFFVLDSHLEEGLRLYLFERLFLPWAGPRAGSLLFAITYLLAWLAAMTLLYRRRVFLRV